MVKTGNVRIAAATGLEIMAAAYLLLNKCVRDGNGQAGVIKGIGNNLGEVPHIRSLIVQVPAAILV